jgi:hypothetical protein
MAIGLQPRLAGLVMTLTQLGYGVGLLLIVPLADFPDTAANQACHPWLSRQAIGVGEFGLLRGLEAALQS